MPSACTVQLADGRTVAVEGAVAEVIGRLCALAPVLTPLNIWKVRASVTGRAVKVFADAPVFPPRSD